MTSLGVNKRQESMFKVIMHIAAIAVLSVSHHETDARAVGETVEVEVTVKSYPSNGTEVTNYSITGSLITRFRDLAGGKTTYRSCLAIKLQNPDAKDGIYRIVDQDVEGMEYPVFCDMTTANGGWTLVASVHENNLSNNGRCTSGDKWSSEQGESQYHPDGDGNWENRRIFGRVTHATSDDYKCPAYYQLDARNVMILQVPNETPPEEYLSAALFQSHTEDENLKNYGGNLYKLFKDHYPLRSGVYKLSQQGPAFAVHYDKGTALTAYEQLGPKAQAESSPGYIQFRAVNENYRSFAVCPVSKINPNEINCEHACIGSTSYGTQSWACGDFSAFDHSGYGIHTGWSTNRNMVESVYMILYR